MPASWCMLGCGVDGNVFKMQVARVACQLVCFQGGRSESRGLLVCPHRPHIICTKHQALVPNTRALLLQCMQLSLVSGNLGDGHCHEQSLGTAFAVLHLQDSRRPLSLERAERFNIGHASYYICGLTFLRLTHADTDRPTQTPIHTHPRNIHAQTEVCMCVCVCVCLYNCTHFIIGM